MTQFGLISDPSMRIPDDWLHWLEVADGVAERLRSDVVEREAANRPPRDEIELLRSTGLVGIALPARFGAPGLPFALAARVVQRLARADAGVAHILAWHYAWTRLLTQHDNEATRRLLAQTVTERWLWASPGTPRHGGPIRLKHDGARLVLNGQVGFATGAPVAQRLFAQTVDEGGRLTIVAVDTSAPGLTIGTDWDMFGQRQSASPGLSFADVTIPQADLIAQLGPVTEVMDPFASVGVLNFQLLFGVLLLGITEGALIEARDFTRERSTPWTHSTAATATEDPFILNAFGEHVAAAHAVSAVVERAERQLQWLHDQGEAVTAEARAEVAEAIASAKITATKTALAATSAIFDLTGARSAATKYGLDRFWRNARTLSLHDPVAYKLNEVGRFFLTGEPPRPSNYR